MKKQLLATVEKQNPNGDEIRIEYLRLTKIGSGIAGTITCHTASNPLNIQHSCLVVEIKK